MRKQTNSIKQIQNCNIKTKRQQEMPKTEDKRKGQKNEKLIEIIGKNKTKSKRKNRGTD